MATASKTDSTKNTATSGTTANNVQTAGTTNNVGTTANAVNTANTGNTAGSSFTEAGIPEWLTGASRGNIDFLSNLRDNGFQSYNGPRVADLNSDQTGAASIIRALAGSNNPYTSQIAGAFGNATNAPAQSVSTSRLIDNVPGQGASGSTQDYMDPYLQSVLAPQLRMQDENAIRQQNALDARATMGGAFGDTRSGFEAAQNTRDANNLRNDTIGRGYSQAFTDAMARKGIDLSRILDVGKTNAGLNETALNRGMMGGAALQGLDKYNTGRTADLATMLGQTGATERGVDQAKLDAQYQEFSRRTGFPLEVSKLLMSAINGTPYDKTTTGATTGTNITNGSTVGSGTTSNTGATTGNTQSNGSTSGTVDSTGTETVQKPDNSGFGILASLLGTLGKAALAPATGGLSMFMPSGTASMAPSPNGPNTYSPMFADGGEPPVGVPSIVGERGPELFVPKEAGTVIPNEAITGGGSNGLADMILQALGSGMYDRSTRQWWRQPNMPRVGPFPTSLSGAGG